MAVVDGGAKLNRAAQLKVREWEKYDRQFQGRQYDIVRVIDLPPGQVFYSVFGRRCHSGYVLRDRATGEEIAVGQKLLKIMHERYLAVSLPRRVRVKRGGAKP